MVQYIGSVRYLEPSRSEYIVNISFARHAIYFIEIEIHLFKFKETIETPHGHQIYPDKRRSGDYSTSYFSWSSRSAF